MGLSLAEIRKKLQEQEAKKDRTKGGSSGGDNAMYPFWNNADGSTAVLRFLPDGDDTNDFFWVEKLTIRLPFVGIKGQPQLKPTEVQVPCNEMWQPRSCPISAEIAPWWKAGKDMEDLARKYWRKKSFIFQGFVVQNPNKEDAENAPENPIRRFAINPSVYDRIKTVFLDQEVENNPIDYENGLDFRLVKGKKGDYADYGTSSWARRERALADGELAAIQTHGLFNLSQFLPKRPDAAHLEAIIGMFQDSIDEKPYDPDKYAQYYKPYGLQVNGNGGGGSSSGDDDSTSTKTYSTPAATERRNVSVTPPSSSSSRTPAPKVSAEDDVDDTPFDVPETKPTRPTVSQQKSVPVEESSSSSPSTETAKKPSSPEDILAALRRRQQANKG
jgi:hypothetical protein